MNENKNGVNTETKSLSLSSFKLPKISKNNLAKSSFKTKKKSKIRLQNNTNNQIKNFFSTKKIKSKLNMHKNDEKDDNNKINRAESELKISKSLSNNKNLLISDSNSLKKVKVINNKINKEKEKNSKEEEEEDDNIHERRKYSKNIMDSLNSRLFSNIIATDLQRPAKDIELIEQEFESEVRKYQLLKIMELNNRIKEGESIKSINDINELYDKNKNINIYNNYFQIKEKTKKKKNLGIRGIKMRSLDLEEINIDKNENGNKVNKEKEDENELSENKNRNKNRRISAKDLKIISYLDIKLGGQTKKEKKKKIDNYFIKDKNIDIELSYFHSLSQVGLNKNGTNKINQEALLELINILGNSKFNIFGIFGGHGKNGHIISRFISRYIKEYFLFSENKLILKKCKTNKELYDLLSKNNYSYIKQLMYECQNSLQNSQIDCDYSGATCLVIFIIENHLICSNIGNCRAIILEKKDLFQLTFDQTLDLPEERKRIEKKGGKIIWSIEENSFSNEEYQIIIKDKDFKSHYIEISRSLGDNKFKEIGVDFAPVITEYILNIETKFVIMATKGLWKVLTNKQAAYYVNKGYKLSNPLESCRKIMEKASEIWQKTSNSRDDISIFVLFFNN